MDLKRNLLMSKKDGAHVGSDLHEEVFNCLAVLHLYTVGIAQRRHKETLFCNEESQCCYSQRVLLRLKHVVSAKRR